VPPRSKGRTGRPWRRIRARVIASSDICWICQERVDKTLPARHPRSASVDHVNAINLGGALRDPANLRLAHYGCNSRRGDGRYDLVLDGLGSQSREW
jgi:5-methylcytosine-specific restriction endonuclease McrA